MILFNYFLSFRKMNNQEKSGFTFSPFYPHFVTKKIDTNVVDAVIHNNKVGMPAVSTTDKNFIKSLFK